MWRATVIATVLAGCGAKLADDHEQNALVDAHGVSTDSDTQNPIPDASMSSPDATTAAARVVYLNFTGVTLTKGASDATTNTASWLNGATTATIPAYGQGATASNTIFNGVTARLAGVATVVRTRPTSGEYVMIIYGGTNAQSRSAYATAVNELDCGDLRKNDVAWITEDPQRETPTSSIDTTMGAIGFGLGLASTNVQADCMCSWGNNCTRTGSPCVLTQNATLDKAVGNNPNTGQPQTCPNLTQDEATTFQTAFH